MDAGTISLLIKWGPLALMAVVFLWFFVIGVIRGTYKVTRRLIYVVLYVLLIWLFMGQITEMVLDLNITINGVKGVRNFIVHSIENNDGLMKFLEYSPNLKGIIIESPEIIVNPILFIVLVLVGLPLSFPIYWIYLIIFNLIAKYAFKRKKYEVDENGEVLRNDKGKKIKVQRKKRRLLGGLIRGVQGVFVFCVVLLPVNLINRIYNRAKNAAELENGETLCSIDDSLEDYKDICGYVDLYNETIFAKLGGKHSLDKVITDRLTTVEYNDLEVNLENELSSVAVSAVLLMDSGIMDLIKGGEINLDTLDLSLINFDKLDKLIDNLFSSSLISELSEAGVKYLLNEVANDKLVDLLKDEDIVSKLEYENVDEIKKELKDVVAILKFAVEKNLADTIIDNREDVVSIVNNISSSDVEVLLNKILSLKILNKAMPSVIAAYGEKYGVQAPNEMTESMNSEVSSLLSRAIKLVQTMELEGMDELKEGNLVDNLVNSLFVNGALKTNTKDELATLLNDLNKSYLFKNVASEQINKLLNDKDYKVDARVLKYVDSKEAWLKELDVLDAAYEIYDEYKENDVIDYANVTELLNDLSGTKVLISVLPFAYDELLPKVGIEIDEEGLPVIDFNKENENASKVEFYDTWEDELVVLKNVADAAGVLELQSLEDIDVDLLDKVENVDALSTIMGEIYKSSLLKEPLVDFMKDTINEFVADYNVEFSKEELLALDTSAKWKNEFTNINNVLSIDFGNEENINGANLNTIFVSVGNMQLFNNKKIDILKYVVEESNFLSQEEYDSISWPASNATQTEIDNYWNNETGVLVNIVNQKDKIEDLSNLSIDTMDVDEIGGLINEVMKSNILKPIVVNKVSKLLIDNDVKDDRDGEGSSINLKASIAGVEDWKIELASIKELVTSIDNVVSTNYVQIVNENRFNKDGNNYTQNDEGTYLKVEGEYYLIEEQYQYNKDGENYVQNDEGIYLKISVTNVDDVFEIIENSDLLSNSRANLLLKAVDTVNIVEVPSDVTVERLMANNYDLYNDERDIIVKISKNKNAFDNVANMKLAKVDTVKIGDLLDTVTSSIIFKDYVVEQIKTVFVSNDVRDDRDIGSSTEKLKENIANVNDWGKELAIIQNMLTMDSVNFNQVTSNEKTNVEKMFDSIEESQLLRNTRANLLIKAITTINLTGVSVPNTVTVTTLSDNDYEQYDKEVNVFITFAENKGAVDGLTDITNLGDSKRSIGEILDAMKESAILEEKYNSTIDTALGNITSNTHLVNYGVEFNDDYSSIIWSSEYEDDNVTIKKKGEIDNLLTISDNIASVASYDTSSLISNYTQVINTIGETLDAVSASYLLGAGQSNIIADEVIKSLTGVPTLTISDKKLPNETWSQAFDRVLSAY